MSESLEIFLGWDDRHPIGHAVCTHSLVTRATVPLAVHALRLGALRASGLYRRPHRAEGNQLFDVISEAPMATEFANSRFLTPKLARGDWALFCDGTDHLFQADVAELFALADPRYAIMVVKHDEQGGDAVKMNDQLQTRYTRKNWSSLILWNCRHPSNAKLTLEEINGRPGRDLHRFHWLDDDEIGSLPRTWNHLVGVSPPLERPASIHYTLGAPFLPGYENGEHSREWWDELRAMNAPLPQR